GGRLRAVGDASGRRDRRHRRPHRAAPGSHPRPRASRRRAREDRRAERARRLHASHASARSGGGGSDMTLELSVPRGFSLAQYAICLKGIVWREALRFLHQRERFVSALVRPLVWLFILAAGFRQVLGTSM